MPENQDEQTFTNSGDGGATTTSIKRNEESSKTPFKGSTYALIQEQLRDLETFTGDPTKISWTAFEYRFTNALEVAPDLPDKMKMALLKQKLAGAPGELISLNPELREQSYEELMSWLTLRYQQIHAPQEEQRKWQPGDTPDSYLVRIQRSAEIDLPPMPAKKLYKRDKDDKLVLNQDGTVILIDNLDYEKVLEKRKNYLKMIDIRLCRDYLEGLKPSLKRKMTDPPSSLEDIHQMVRRMYIHELKHPDTADESPAASKNSSGLSVFMAQTINEEASSKDDMRKAFDSLKDMIQTLTEAMIETHKLMTNISLTLEETNQDSSKE